MSAHTPGPWVVHPTSIHPAVRSVGTAEVGPRRICTVGSTNGNPIDWHNARLIADAPRMHDLLAACEPYLKEGETPAQRIERERRDTAFAMGVLAKERIKNEFALAALRRVKETRVRLGAVAQGMVDDAIKMAEGTT